MKFIELFCFISILLGACKTQHDYPIKSKYYEVTRFKSSDKNDTFIFGNFKEFATNYPIPFPMVKFMPDKPYVKGDLKGNYKFY